MATIKSPQDTDGYNADVEKLRDEEYPMLNGSIYLDHAGTTPYPKSLMDRFAHEMTSNLFGNPHSASASSQLSTSRIEDIRLRVLQFFNADPADFDVVFVANATAGIKLVAEAMRALPGGFDYAYHQLSHTSLVGVREEARKSVCVDDGQVDGWLAGDCPFGNDDSTDSTVLFAYPAQSNMDGRRLPSSWTRQLRQHKTPGVKRTYTLLDAASLVCSSPLDLSHPETAPDFTVLSFYKIFGFPDLGALIVRREASDVFNTRRYFGGGTVDMVVCLREQWHASKGHHLHERLEDGTLPVHSIVALGLAMDVHESLFGSMQKVAAHTQFLTRRLHDGLRSLRHGNNEHVCTIYSSDINNQTGSTFDNGPIIAFNICNSLGAWMSLTEFEKLATLKQFHIRTGGVCNPGGIASALGLQTWEMKHNFTSGFRCGTDNDIMAGKPTGVIRVSLGAMSTVSDVDKFVDFVGEFYRDDSLPFRQPEPALLPHRKEPRLHIQAISVYPIKSCGGFQVPPGVNWEVRPEGLAWDREWCLVHRGSGQALSQKRHPRMALIRPWLDFERGELRVTYEGHDAPPDLPKGITVPLSKNPEVFRHHLGSARSMSSRVCGEEIVAQTYASAEINNFFSGVLEVPCVLARFPPGGEGKSMRHSKAHLQKHQGKQYPASSSCPGLPSPPESDSERSSERRILLSNESPILAISMASLDALNKEIKLKGGREVSAAVFRANVVVASSVSPASSLQETTPYGEDNWSTLRIGHHNFKMLGSCRRCHMVCINQETAEKSEEPFVTLSKTRRFDGKVFFGTHMCYTPGAEALAEPLSKEAQHPTIRVGDVVRPDL
ncbi:pyridoxal phosphate-dependent transferase [Bombardia bombarda]|uniref:Molybdenum cofactor sulfurase n=1 Tax=Bombardia bombarda TaxID=252184 RepID=A0AA39WMX6_9PEZI|nr:pyridoxal phosphate-dependent transferase [Bombardia bombarda]